MRVGIITNRILPRDEIMAIVSGNKVNNAINEGLQEEGNKSFVVNQLLVHEMIQDDVDEMDCLLVHDECTNNKKVIELIQKNKYDLECEECDIKLSSYSEVVHHKKTCPYYKVITKGEL